VAPYEVLCVKFIQWLDNCENVWFIKLRESLVYRETGESDTLQIHGAGARSASYERSPNGKKGIKKIDLRSTVSAAENAALLCAGAIDGSAVMILSSRLPISDPMDEHIGPELESRCPQKRNRCYNARFYAAYCCPYVWNKRLSGTTETFEDQDSDLRIFLA
jgi:hypothetical protein